MKWYKIMTLGIQMYTLVYIGKVRLGGVCQTTDAHELAVVTFFFLFFFSSPTPRYGERNTPFCVTLLEGQKGDSEFSRRINNAVERAASDYHSGTSSDEEGANSSMSSSSSSNSTRSAPEPKCIPTVSNPNSVYQVFNKTGSCHWSWRFLCSLSFLYSNKPTPT